MADKKSDGGLKGGTPAAVTVGRLLSRCKRRLTIAFAESCTGGLASSMITDVAGSSDYFQGGVVAYSNGVKRKVLGVKAETLRRYGAVSPQTAAEMSLGVRRKLCADIGVAITGIAGPTGGSMEKPVGTVFMCAGNGSRSLAGRFAFKGTRTSIKKQSAIAAVKLLCRFLKGAP